MAANLIQPEPLIAWPSTTVSDHSSSAYHAGCLLALLQQIQDSDDGDLNATYTDRYFNAASECPARVLPRLVDLAMKRNRRLFRTNPRLSIDYRAELVRIHSRVRDSLPGRLNMHGKADFQLGYFHQLASRLPGKDRDRVRYKTKDGTSVKSRGEVTVSDALFGAGISYRYEPKITVELSDSNEVVMFPDFEVSINDHTLWIEYLGMLGDSGYTSRWIGKLRTYEKELGCRRWVDIQTDRRLASKTLMTVEPEQIDSVFKVEALVEQVRLWMQMAN